MKDIDWPLVFILGGGLWYLSNNNNAGQNYFFVPGVGDVPENELENYGYVKFNGKWFKYTDLQAAAQANGVTQPGNIDVQTQTGWDIFLTLLNAGAAIATTVINNNAQRKADLIEQILTKYTLAFSSAYDGNFPYSEYELQQMTIKELEQILGGNYSVSGTHATRYARHINSNHWTANL